MYLVPTNFGSCYCQQGRGWELSSGLKVAEIGASSLRMKVSKNGAILKPAAAFSIGIFHRRRSRSILC